MPDIGQAHSSLRTDLSALPFTPYMRHLCLLLVLLCAAPSAFAQISIDRADMPNANDTFRYSESDNMLGIIDLNDTGPAHTWDYSHLASITQRVDTFVDPIFGTPLIYNVTFSNIFDIEHFATIAQRNPLAAQMGFGPIQLTDVYDYYREEDGFWANVGMGATINAVPLTSTMEPRDFIYQFPLTFGDSYSGFSQYGFEIPTFGYFGSKRDRTTVVDGYGTISTRYGTFEAIRVKSTSNLIDTISFNGFGFEQPRPTEVEVKWLAKGIRTPLLRVVARQFQGQDQINTVEYLDSLRGYTPGSGVGMAGPTQPDSFSVVPNPATDRILLRSIRLNGPVAIRLTDLSGRTVATLSATAQAHTAVVHIPAHIGHGLYLLHVPGHAPQRLLVQGR